MSLLKTQPSTLSSSQKLWALFGVGVGVFMSTLDVGIINVALPTLVSQLQTTFPEAQWAVLSYQLVSSSLVLAATRLGDMWGKKSLYQAGLITFTLGSLLCGLAPNINFLIGFRALQGLGAVFLSGLGLAIIAEIFPNSERGRAVGIIGSVVSLGVALGPSLGGLFLYLAGWRSVFLINVPLGIIATVLVAKVVPSSVLSKEKQRFDMIGAILALLTLSSFALGMTQGQREGFNSNHAVTLLVLSIIGFVSFLIVETRIKQPLLEINLFRNLRLSMSLLSNWLVFIVLSGLMLVIPFFLERVKQYPTSKVGLLLAISPIVSGLIAPISGAMSDRFGSRLIGVTGLGLMVGACWAISTFDAQTTELGYTVPYFIYGTGLGLFRSPNDSTVMGAVPRERLGIASGLLSLSRTCGVTVGIAVMGAIFTGLSASIDVATASSEAIVAGFQGTFRASAIILSVAALASAFRFHKSNAAYR